MRTPPSQAEHVSSSHSRVLLSFFAYGCCHRRPTVEIENVNDAILDPQGERDRVVLVLLDQRAATFVERPECLLSRDLGRQLVVIPRSFGFGWFLDLEEIHVVHVATIHAD